ncbi:MAG: GNAT family N-acetyltransferase, partial [Anaerolineae bacterium]|nr:GNAT family N-acetyltransferase [Anaerolineae bacterium]
MAAAGLASASTPFSGLRPIHVRRDLGAVADLIEFCFAPTLDAAGRSAIQEMRMISRSGPLLWTLGRLSSVVPGLMQGFVWIEQGRLVGNVSLAPAGYGGGWLIANVAVHPDYRRRGIARRLMAASMDLIAQRGAFAVLQVEADNSGAYALYEGLGFHELRTFTRWRRATHHVIPPALPESLPLRQLTPRDGDRLAALAELVRPDHRGGIGWLRPLDRR